MKILHVLYSGLGGHGNVFFSMVDADEQGEFTFEALFNGIEEVKAEYIEHCTAKNIPWHFIPKKPGLDIPYFARLYRQIKKARPGIIFLHGGAAAIPAKLAKITGTGIQKIIVRETQANHLKTRIDWFYLATAMLLADKMVYLSEAYRQQVKAKLTWLFREKRSVVIPNGINLLTYGKTTKPHDASRVVLGMQSRLIDIKDHLTLLDAFALLLKKEMPVTLQLQIAGDGAFKKTLEEKAAALQITNQVIFTGMLEEKELVDFLQQLDIYIHASLGETMSTAIMQAMACGKPIIASDVPGIDNMIEHDITGILVPAKNAVALAAAIERLINNPHLADKLADNAFTFAQTNYSGKKMLDNYKDIFTN
ncbi:MAG: glycosyltransferase family 4 protein [Chitinophagaceae bacterium]|nr:glycosyltransferase family 4 protein [Chitinophagaceae bacterium]